MLEATGGSIACIFPSGTPPRVWSSFQVINLDKNSGGGDILSAVPVHKNLTPSERFSLSQSSVTHWEEHSMTSLRNLKSPFLVILLCACFAVGFFGARRVSAQEGVCSPQGSIGDCTHLFLDYQTCLRGCCSSPPSGQPGCCTHSYFTCYAPSLRNHVTRVCYDAACNPTIEAQP